MFRPESGASAEPEREPPDTKHCQECSSEINAKAEICPDCGVRQPNLPGNTRQDERAKQYLIGGIILGFLAILFNPII